MVIEEKKRVKTNFLMTDNQPFGYIYLALNTLNGKIYIGKTEYPRNIITRWKEHLKEGRHLKKLRKQNPNKRISDTHLNNAIAKYGDNVWIVKNVDVAFNSEDLTMKENYWIKYYDSMNREKGYNMTEGGAGAKLREEVKLKISKTIRNKWKEPEYRSPIIKKIQERFKDPEYKRRAIQILKRGSEKRWSNPKERERMKKIITKINREKVKNPDYIKKQIKAHKNERKEIRNISKFLLEIKNGRESRELTKKYLMSRPTLNKRVKEILGKYSVNNFKEAQMFLKDKSINEILR
ncbi:MAG: GIY-YIG nuclease family protein [Candidatus Hodarchaeota archaeon]